MMEYNTCSHCWHDTGTKLDNNQQLDICCHCGATNLHAKSEPVKHGEYLPKKHPLVDISRVELEPVDITPWVNSKKPYPRWVYEGTSVDYKTMEALAYFGMT